MSDDISGGEQRPASSSQRSVVAHEHSPPLTFDPLNLGADVLFCQTEIFDRSSDDRQPPSFERVDDCLADSLVGVPTDASGNVVNRSLSSNSLSGSSTSIYGRKRSPPSRILATHVNVSFGTRTAADIVTASSNEAKEKVFRRIGSKAKSFASKVASTPMREYIMALEQSSRSTYVVLYVLPKVVGDSKCPKLAPSCQPDDVVFKRRLRDLLDTKLKDFGRSDVVTFRYLPADCDDAAEVHLPPAASTPTAGRAAAARAAFHKSHSLDALERSGTSHPEQDSSTLRQRTQTVMPAAKGTSKSLLYRRLKLYQPPHICFGSIGLVLQFAEHQAETNAPPDDKACEDASESSTAGGHKKSLRERLFSQDMNKYNFLDVRMHSSSIRDEWWRLLSEHVGGTLLSELRRGTAVAEDKHSQQQVETIAGTLKQRPNIDAFVQFFRSGIEVAVVAEKPGDVKAVSARQPPDSGILSVCFSKTTLKKRRVSVEDLRTRGPDGVTKVSTVVEPHLVFGPCNARQVVRLVPTHAFPLRLLSIAAEDEQWGNTFYLERRDPAATERYLMRSRGVPRLTGDATPTQALTSPTDTTAPTSFANVKPPTALMQREDGAADAPPQEDAFLRIELAATSFIQRIKWFQWFEHILGKPTKFVNAKQGVGGDGFEELDAHAELVQERQLDADITASFAGGIRTAVSFLTPANHHIGAKYRSALLSNTPFLGRSYDAATAEEEAPVSASEDEANGATASAALSARDETFASERSPGHSDKPPLALRGVGLVPLGVEDNTQRIIPGAQDEERSIVAEHSGSVAANAAPAAVGSSAEPPRTPKRSAVAFATPALGVVAPPSHLLRSGSHAERQTAVLSPHAIHSKSEVVGAMRSWETEEASPSPQDASSSSQVDISREGPGAVSICPPPTEPQLPAEVSLCLTPGLIPPRALRRRAASASPRNASPMTTLDVPSPAAAAPTSQCVTRSAAAVGAVTPPDNDEASVEPKRTVGLRRVANSDTPLLFEDEVLPTVVVFRPRVLLRRRDLSTRTIQWLETRDEDVEAEWYACKLCILQHPSAPATPTDVFRHPGSAAVFKRFGAAIDTDVCLWISSVSRVRVVERELASPPRGHNDDSNETFLWGPSAHGSGQSPQQAVVDPFVWARQRAPSPALCHAERHRGERRLEQLLVAHHRNDDALRRLQLALENIDDESQEQKRTVSILELHMDVPSVYGEGDPRVVKDFVDSVLDDASQRMPVRDALYWSSVSGQPLELHVPPTAHATTDRVDAPEGNVFVARCIVPYL